MVLYEMLCVIADLERPALIESVKRVIKCITDNGGMVRELENLGVRKTPSPFRSHKRVRYEGLANYLLIRYHGRPDRNALIAHQTKHEVIRRRIFGLGFEFPIGVFGKLIAVDTAEDAHVHGIIDEIDKASMAQQVGSFDRVTPQLLAARKATKAVDELISPQSAMTTTCICERYGRFVSDHVEYDKPVANWGKRIIDPLYRRRL